MTPAEFRALLTWRMVSDPMPEAADLPIVDGLLNREAVARGYADWVDAYHLGGRTDYCCVHGIRLFDDCGQCETARPTDPRHS